MQPALPVVISKDLGLSPFLAPCNVSANVFQCSMDKVLPTDLLCLPRWSPLLIIAAKD